MDGVLIDSKLLVKGAFIHTFATFNIPDERHFFGTTALSGLSLVETYQTVAPDADISKLTKAHAAFQNDNLHLVTPFDDAVVTLKELRRKGVNIGVITNRSINARHILEHCGLDSLIDLVVSVEDVVNPKPHPEGILKAMAHFGSKPYETIMVGDMPVDITAGKSAGVTTVAVDTSNCLDELRKNNPSFLIQRVSELIPLFFS